MLQYTGNAVGLINADYVSHNHYDTIMMLIITCEFYILMYPWSPAEQYH